MSIRLSHAGLLPYQPPAAASLLRALINHGAALDASDMGVGKTYTAGAVIRALNVPSLVVCPKVSIAGWETMGARLGTEFDALNYEMLRTGRTVYGEWFTHPLDGKPHFRWHKNIKLLLFDEAHRCTSLDDTLQAKMMIAARNQKIPTVALSATIAETPLNFRALGYLLGLHRLTGVDGFVPWSKERGVEYSESLGLHFTADRAAQRTHLDRLNKELFPGRGCRVRISDLGDAFPECQIKAELVDVEDPEKFNKLMESMGPAIEALKAGRKPCAWEQAKLIFAWQESEMLMVPVYVEMAKDAMASGRSVALFVNFRATLEELSRRLDTCSVIHGGQRGESGERERRRNIAWFQANRERVIISTAASGGVSIDLHDTDGNFPRIGIVSLGWSAKILRQVFGRLRRQGGKSKALYRCPLAKGTIQEKIHRNVAPKLDRIDLLNDGVLTDADLAPFENLPLDLEGMVDNFEELS